VTVPAEALTTFNIALVASTISIAVAPALSVVTSPSRVMLLAPPPPSRRIDPPVADPPLLSALMVDADV